MILASVSKLVCVVSPNMVKACCVKICCNKAPGSFDASVSKTTCQCEDVLKHNIPQTFIMEVMIAILFLILMVQKTCKGENQRFIEIFYLAENRALLNHMFQWETVSSVVICGRDCSQDPQCASFNYQTNNICILNNASRAHSPDDFLEIQGSAYYDDNVDTLSCSLPSITRYIS